MAVIKIFDSLGVKTLILMGNAAEQDYDPESDEDEFSNFVVEEEDN